MLNEPLDEAEKRAANDVGLWEQRRDSLQRFLQGVRRRGKPARVVVRYLEKEIALATKEIARLSQGLGVLAATGVFAWLAILAPRRVWQEETGDALEVIAAMEKAGCSAFKIRLKVWSTVVWVLLNGLRELVAGLSGRKSPLK